MTSNESAGAEIVCLVDDDQAVLKSVSRLLTSDGFEVRRFNEPEKFLEYIQTGPVSVVVLDIWMGQISGLEVQAKLAKAFPTDSRHRHDRPQRSWRGTHRPGIRHRCNFHQAFRRSDVSGRGEERFSVKSRP